MKSITQIQQRFLDLSLNHFQHASSSEWTQKIIKYLTTPPTSQLTSNSYSSQRFYHDATHVASLLALYDKFQNRIHFKEQFQLVIFFHDLVYNVHRKDNETASSREFLLWSLGAKNLSDAHIQWVKRTIDATAHHLKSAKMWADRVDELRQQMDDALRGNVQLDGEKLRQITQTLREYEDSLRFLDMDLAVLQWDRVDYARYAHQIQQEYSPLFHGDLSKYRNGRINFLQSFLQEERFYYSDLSDEGWESRARANLEWEREKLLSEDLESRGGVSQ